MGKRPTFSDELRRAIECSGKSRYRISKESGVAQTVLCRFVHGKTGMSLESVDRICACLRLRLVAEDEPPRKKTR